MLPTQRKLCPHKLRGRAAECVVEEEEEEEEEVLLTAYNK